MSSLTVYSVLCLYLRSCFWGDGSVRAEFIQNLINNGENFNVSVTLASGITYSGSGRIEGDLNFNSNDGSLEFAFRSEKFEQI